MPSSTRQPMAWTGARGRRRRALGKGPLGLLAAQLQATQPQSSARCCRQRHCSGARPLAPWPLQTQGLPAPFRCVRARVVAAPANLCALALIRIFSWGAFAASQNACSGETLVAFVTARVVRLHECETHVSMLSAGNELQAASAVLSRGPAAPRGLHGRQQMRLAVSPHAAPPTGACPDCVPRGTPPVGLHRPRREPCLDCARRATNPPLPPHCRTGSSWGC
jgi:hypothetical protein